MLNGKESFHHHLHWRSSTICSTQIFQQHEYHIIKRVESWCARALRNKEKPLNCKHYMRIGAGRVLGDRPACVGLICAKSHASRERTLFREAGEMLGRKDKNAWHKTDCWLTDCSTAVRNLILSHTKQRKLCASSATERSQTQKLYSSRNITIFKDLVPVAQHKMHFAVWWAAGAETIKW